MPFEVMIHQGDLWRCTLINLKVEMHHMDHQVPAGVNTIKMAGFFFQDFLSAPDLRQDGLELANENQRRKLESERREGPFIGTSLWRPWQRRG